MRDSKENLAIVAHPDDESFFLAGQLLSENSQTHVVSLTNGSNGKTFSADQTHLTHIRQKEFSAAASNLGSTHEMLDLPDGAISLVNAVPVIQELLSLYKPQKIISLNEAGITGHPDHINISNAIFLAILSLLDRGEDVPKEWVMPFEKKISRYFDRYYSERIKVDSTNRFLTEEEVKINLSDEEIRVKLKAAQQHKSQQHWIDHLARVGYLTRPSESYIKKNLGKETLLQSFSDTYRVNERIIYPLLKDADYYEFKGPYSYNDLQQISKPYVTATEAILRGKKYSFRKSA